jgi:hypothetical protein
MDREGRHCKDCGWGVEKSGEFGRTNCHLEPGPLKVWDYSWCSHWKDKRKTVWEKIVGWFRKKG